MNILLDATAAIRYDLIYQLTMVSGASIYLSISDIDTIRIMKEIKPEVAIFENDSNLPDERLTKISDTFPYIDIYVCRPPFYSHPEFTNYRNQQCISLDDLGKWAKMNEI